MAAASRSQSEDRQHLPLWNPLYIAAMHFVAIGPKRRFAAYTNTSEVEGEADMPR
jgi:hypothetical protein